MKNVKGSAFLSNPTPWKLWRMVNTDVQAFIMVHLEEPVGKFNWRFYDVIGLQIIDVNILYQAINF